MFKSHNDAKKTTTNHGQALKRLVEVVLRGLKTTMTFSSFPNLYKRMHKSQTEVKKTTKNHGQALQRLVEVIELSYEVLKLQ